MKLTDEELYQLCNDIIDLAHERMKGCPLDEGIANLQVIIGCLYEQMRKNVGEFKAIMALGQVMKKAAADAGPDSGVIVDFVQVPKGMHGKH